MELNFNTVLPLVIIVLTAMLMVIGTQFYFILKEFRLTIQKLNKVLDDTGTISESVSKPINMVSTMLMGIRGGSAIMKIFSKNNK